jgi:hypothetical protein
VHQEAFFPEFAPGLIFLPMTPLERQSLWADRIHSWKSSGRSADAFARGHGFSGQALRYWAERLGLHGSSASSSSSRSPKKSKKITPSSHNPPPSSPPRFVQVVTAHLPSSDELLLELGAVRLRVRKGFDPDLLRSVVLTLSEKP